MLSLNIKNQFPIFNQKLHNKRLIYLDNAATTQKPISVINAISDFYSNENINIDRGYNTMGINAYNKVEKTRNLTKEFINATKSSEIIFTSGATESTNIIASCLKNNKKLFNNGNIIISKMEHHSNYLPWLNLYDSSNDLYTIPLTSTGELDLDVFKKILHKKGSKLICITYASNVIGTINDIQEICKLSHNYNGIVIVDATQATPHLSIDVQKLDCDFMVFSSHKMYGPMGIGVLYGKERLLNDMVPHKLGGGMIKKVKVTNTSYNINFADTPAKFEAGTQNIAGIIGLHHAIKFINDISLEKIQQHEKLLFEYLEKKLLELEMVKIICNPKHRVPLISFIIDNINHLDIGMLLDANGIIVRTGNHCAQPLLESLSLDGTVRVSLGVYNDKDDIDEFVACLKKSIDKLS